MFKVETMSSDCRLTLVSTIFLLALCFLQATSQGQQKCGNAISCGDCVSQAGCAWCTDTNFTTIRCLEISRINSSGCAVIENPSGNVGDRTLNVPGQNPIDVKNIVLNLRPGEPQSFPVRITALRNLPLDLYILMDLSSSMGPVLTNVQMIADAISVRISNVTDNSRLAFGSYNDKNLFPFTPSVREDDFQSLPFAFQHRIDFTDNTTAFSEELSDVRVTLNIDNAENTLEALAQVVACEEVLGWRRRDTSQVSRLVLVLTDAGFHYAGEGQLAGILNPYLGDCLLTRTAGQELIEFTQFDVVDYPSVGQISELLLQRDVNVIFGVTAVNVETYQSLAALTNGRAVVSELNVMGEAAELVDIIDDAYRQLLRDIFLRVSPDSTSSQWTVDFVPVCPTGSMVRMGNAGCTNVQLEDSVDFMVTVTLNNCDGLQNGETRTITLDGGAFGSVLVTVTGVCDCGCENFQDRFSDRCSNNGNFTCGVCECNPGFCGPTCNLRLDGTTNPTTSCPTGGPLFFNQICSGRGQCNCRCFCPDGFFGEACECDTTTPSCIAPGDTEVCSGRGMCCNGMCTCQNSPMGNPYRGTNTQNFCQCEPVAEVCEFQGEECNNRGTCLCDRCDCLSEWAGDMCQIPRADRCSLSIDTECIETCREAPNSAPEHCMVCNQERPTLFVNMVEISSANGDADVENFANRILDYDGLPFSLIRGGGSNARCESTINVCVNTYYILDNGVRNALVVIREQDCPEVTGFQLAIPIWSIALIVVGALILLGILIIIIIKIIFVILDWAEVRRWQKEAREADFSKNQNPLYQSPETEHINITYGKTM